MSMERKQAKKKKKSGRVYDDEEKDPKVRKIQ
jgi:hypothetical protein